MSGSRKSRVESANFSLFPFLAVLLCTMGMLVIILVLFSRQTSGTTGEENLCSRRISALKTSDVPQENNIREYESKLVQHQGATLEDLEAERETAGWFLEELQSVLDRTDGTLETERNRLSETERAIAKIVEETRVLKQQVTLLQKDKDEETQTPRENELKEEIAETLQKAALLKQEIADLEQKKDTGSKSYAIIPYQGTSGTFRRPIFIECTETGVFLMPEGIEFTWEDFLLDRYPGNPFDTAIRSVSQYMKETDPNAKINPEGYEPYPLLIVRPGGTEKYYRVVAALVSWGGVYGYELVDESDEIEYPPRNNELYNRVTDQVSLARYKLQVPLASLLAEMRQKQEQTDWLAVQSVSENENRQGGESLLQSKLGQNVRLAGNVASDKRQGFSGETVAGYASGQPDQRSGTGLATNNPRGTGSGFASTGNFALTPEDGGGEMMSETRLPQYKGQYAENQGTGIRQPVLSEQSGRWETGGSGVPGFTTFGSMGHGMTGSSNGISNGKNQSGSPGSSPQGIQENLTSGNSDGPDYSRGDTAGSMTGGTLASSSSQLLNQSRNIQSPKAGTVTGESPPLKNRWETVGNTVYKQNGDGTSAEGTSRQTGQNSPKEKTGEQKNVNPLPENAILLSQELRKPASAASERPVSVRIYADRVVFPAQPGLKNEQTIPMTDDFSGAFDQMVDAVAACVRGWGVAGRNMYWMPWIKATVEENAEPQFEQFYRFFVDQGISVRR